MQMAYLLVAFYMGWIVVQIALGKKAFDPYPFVFLLFISNALQLWWLPVLSVGQNVLAREDEIQQDRMETVLRNQSDTMSALMAVMVRLEEAMGDVALDVDAIAKEWDGEERRRGGPA